MSGSPDAEEVGIMMPPLLRKLRLYALATCEPQSGLFALELGRLGLALDDASLLDVLKKGRT